MDLKGDYVQYKTLHYRHIILSITQLQSLISIILTEHIKVSNILILHSKGSTDQIIE